MVLKNVSGKPDTFFVIRKQINKLKPKNRQKKRFFSRMIKRKRRWIIYMVKNYLIGFGKMLLFGVSWVYFHYFCFKKRKTKQRDVEEDMPLVNMDAFGTPIGLDGKPRMRHVYISGMAGIGKASYLENVPLVKEEEK